MDDALYDCFPELHTPRLRLRELTQRDTEAVYRVGSDEAVMRYYDLDTFTSAAEAGRFIARQQNRFASRRGIRWGITRKEEDTILGWCGFVLIPNERMELGYALAREAWRQGIMTEALQAVIPLIFAQTDLDRLEATVIVGNTASERLLDKIGFTAVGTMRACSFGRGQYHDLTMYSLLRQDWKAKPSDAVGIYPAPDPNFGEEALA